MKLFFYFFTTCFLLIGSSYLNSCQKSDHQELSTPIETSVSPITYQSMYMDITSEYDEIIHQMNVGTFGTRGNNILSMEEEQMLNTILSTIQEKGLFETLSTFGVEEDIIFAIDYCLMHIDDVSLFDNLITLFPNLTEEEIKIVFHGVNYSKIIELCTGSTRAKMTVGCGIALAGAVVGCASAVAIGNVAGLCWWAASYSITLAGVITSCT